jgi:N-acetylglutamate synthase-like GNAT family acetyltransferase
MNWYGWRTDVRVPRNRAETKMPCHLPAELTVRVAAPKDAPAVTALLQASFPALMRPSYDPAVLSAALPLVTRANPALLSSGTYYVAEIAAGGLAGCGGWTRERPGSGEIVPGIAHIRHFATHVRWTGRCVGRAIYARCEEAARSAGVTRFEASAGLNAEGFYAALGFKTVRRIEVPMAPGLKLPAILMERSL